MKKMSRIRKYSQTFSVIDMNKIITTLIALLFSATSVFAKTITVTSGADSGAGTLREAVTSADNGDVIVFADNVSTVTFQGRIDIHKNITICGNENSTTTLVTGDPWDYTIGAGRRQLFHLGGTADVTFKNLTMNGVVSNCSGSAIANYGKCTIHACVFRNNSCPTGSIGGAIYSRGDLYITNSIFSGNVSNGGGGGAIAICDGTNTITNSLFYANTANGQGGAVAVTRVSSDGISWTHPVVSIYNSTFVDNRSVGNPWDAHAIINRATLNLYNTVIWTIASEGKALATNGANAVTTAYYNLIGNHGTEFGGVFVNDSGNIFGENPLFNADYSLQAASPAIDKGNNEYLTEITKDVAGNLRISNGTVDMGAYEFQHNYTVTFSGEEINIDLQTISNGNLATRPANPERAGYDFAGWFTDNGTFLNEWNFATDIVTQDTTLYAKWSSTTGIKNIKAENEHAKIVAYYNIMGQKLPQAPASGIYIILYDNGKSEKIIK
jgi:uncharacterized repeat protein (TIGR02543 family)